MENMLFSYAASKLNKRKQKEKKKKFKNTTTSLEIRLDLMAREAAHF